MTKICNISHADTDGVGAHMIIREVFGRENTDVFFTNYPFTERQLNSIDKYVVRAEENKNPYSAVIITDLSFKAEDRDWIIKLKSSFPDNTPFILVDHHDSTDMNLSDLFSDFFVDKSGNYAGAGLCLKLFKDRIHTTPERMKDIIHFNKVADSYDLWTLDEYWKEGEKLTDLIELFSPYDVKDWTYEMLANPKSDFILKQLLESMDGKKKYALKLAEQNCFERVVKKDNREFKVKLFFSNTYRNYLCHNLDADIALCANPSTLSISFRSKTEAVRLHEFCAKYQGGGHVQAAACRFPKDKFFTPEVILDEFEQFIVTGE